MQVLLCYSFRSCVMISKINPTLLQWSKLKRQNYVYYFLFFYLFILIFRGSSLKGRLKIINNKIMTSLTVKYPRNNLASANETTISELRPWRRRCQERSNHWNLIQILFFPFPNQQIHRKSHLLFCPKPNRRRNPHHLLQHLHLKIRGLFI